MQSAPQTTEPEVFSKVTPLQDLHAIVEEVEQAGMKVMKNIVGGLVTASHAGQLVFKATHLREDRWSVIYSRDYFEEA